MTAGFGISALSTPTGGGVAGADSLAGGTLLPPAVQMSLTVWRCKRRCSARFCAQNSGAHHGSAACFWPQRVEWGQWSGSCHALPAQMLAKAAVLWGPSNGEGQMATPCSKSRQSQGRSGRRSSRGGRSTETPTYCWAQNWRGWNPGCEGGAALALKRRRHCIKNCVRTSCFGFFLDQAKGSVGV